jgi:hypothetical protein
VPWSATWTLVLMSSFWIGCTWMVTFGFAAWKSSATFWNADFTGSVEPLCHQVNVTGLPPLTWPDGAGAEEAGAADDEAADGEAAAAVELPAAAGVDDAAAPDFFELEQPAIASDATATTAVARATRWRRTARGDVSVLCVAVLRKRMLPLVMRVPSAVGRVITDTPVERVRVRPVSRLVEHETTGRAGDSCDRCATLSLHLIGGQPVRGPCYNRYL